MPTNWTKDEALTQHIYESSEEQRLNQQINEIHQRHNEKKVKADLGGDHEPAEFENADFPPLNGVVGKDQNGSDAIPPVPAQVVPTGTHTWQQVVKGESSSASGMSDSGSNLPCAENPSEQKNTSTSPNANADDEPSEDPESTNASDAVKSDLDVGQVSATTESASSCTTMSMNGVNGQEPHSKNNLSNPNPENPSEQQISSSTSSNANADEPPEDPSSNAAAVYSDWSPLDDNIEVLLPGSDKAPSREEVDAYISSVASGPKRRLSVFEAVCEGKYLKDDGVSVNIPDTPCDTCSSPKKNT